MPQPIRIKFEEEGVSETQKRVDALTARMDKLRGETSNFREELKQSKSPLQDFSSGIRDVIQNLLLTGGAAVVMQQGFQLAKETVQDYLKAAEKQPELFTQEQLQTAQQLSETIEETTNSFTKLKIAIIDTNAEGLEKGAGFMNDLIEASMRANDVLPRWATFVPGVSAFVGALELAAGPVNDLGEALETNVNPNMGAFIRAAESSDRAMLVYAESAAIVHGVTYKVAESFGELLDLTEKTGSEIDKLHKTEQKIREEFELGKYLLMNTMTLLPKMRKSLQRQPTKGY